jgi:hypothetical protein
MNNLKKSYRLSVYKQMLAKIEETPVYPVDDEYISNRPLIHRINYCSILDDIGCPYGWGSLTELAAKRPKIGWIKNDAFWFHPYDRIRVNILKEIIFNMELSWFDRLRRFCHSK